MGRPVADLAPRFPWPGDPGDLGILVSVLRDGEWRDVLICLSRGWNVGQPQGP